TSKSCHGFLNPEKVAAALGKQAVVALKVYKALELAQKTVKLSFYLKAVINPLEISEIIQIYYKDLREACVRVSQNGELDEEYESGETIYPEVKIEAQSYYANWEKSGFKVDWKVETGNGSVNLP